MKINYKVIKFETNVNMNLQFVFLSKSMYFTKRNDIQ